MDGSLDLAFARLPTPYPELQSRIVEVEQILCALPEGHPRAHQATLTLSELHDEDFISLPADTGSMLQATMFALCITAGFRPRIAQVAPDSATVLALVAAGAGVSITLSSVCPVQTVGIVYRPLADVSPSHLFATITWRREDRSPTLETVLSVAEHALPTPDLSGFPLKSRQKSIGMQNNA
jgi:DNA-binding transcriptional LysR family regulator